MNRLTIWSCYLPRIDEHAFTFKTWFAQGSFLLFSWISRMIFVSSNLLFADSESLFPYHLKRFWLTSSTLVHPYDQFHFKLRRRILYRQGLILGLDSNRLSPRSLSFLEGRYDTYPYFRSSIYQTHSFGGYFRFSPDLSALIASFWNNPCTTIDE